MIIIKRETYTIKTWEKSDALSLAKNLNDKSIWNNSRNTLPYPYTLKDADEFINMAMSQPSVMNFCISIDGNASGNVNFSPRSDIERFTSDIGYWISAEHRNKNIMTNALIDCIEYYFNKNNTIRICAEAFDYNMASQQVLQKTGFEKVGIKRKAVFKNGQFVDLHEFELIKAKGYITLRRTDSDSGEFKNLISKHNQEFESYTGIYKQDNNEISNYIVIAYFDNKPVGCGAFNNIDDNTIEIKKLYVLPEFRQSGIFDIVLTDLEQWAKESNYNKVVIEARYPYNKDINIYEDNGYCVIESFGNYKYIENSVCYGKELE